jgi:hypothetical protein
MNVDLRTFSKRNLWLLPSGQVAVRPGLRLLKAAESSRKIVGGFSVQNPYTGEVWHYIADVATTGPKACVIRIYDEAWINIQAFATGVDAEPSVLTHAVVLDQVMICAPELPTMWGLLGSGITLAVKEDSDNPTTTAIDVPRGMCVAWTNRCVIANGPDLYISDPVAVTGGSPKTFVGQNQLTRDGRIHGLHVASSGALVVCHSRGVEALPEDAAAAGQVALGNWQRLTDHVTSRYQSTCVSQGRLWALTRTGLKLIDSEAGEEQTLDEPAMPSAFRSRIASSDYRAGARLLGGDAGPIVSLDLEAAFSMGDESRQFRSWWTMTHSAETARIRGLLRTSDGEEMLLTEKGAYYVGGNFDGENGSYPDTENGTPVLGGFLGVVPSPPDLSPVVRRVDFGSDTGGAIKVSVRGEPKSVTGSQSGTIIGTATWDTSTAGFGNPPVQSQRFHWATRTDDLAIEVMAERPLSRVSDTVDIEMRGPGKRRP